MANITKLERKKGIAYRIRASVGYDINGKQISKAMYWTPEPGMTEKQIQKELTRIAVDFERQVENGETFENIKFAEVAEKWLEYVKANLSPKYHIESERKLKVINPEIGHIPLKKLKKAHIQALYKKLEETPRIVKTKDGQTIEKYKSPETIRHYHRLVSAILTKAVQWDFIDSNPCLGKKIDLPKRERYKPRYLQDDEVIQFVGLLEDAPVEYKTFLSLLIYTGMRNAECMGLEWQDIDFQNSMINIARTSQYLPKKGIITKDCKNTSSERALKVVPEVITLLKQYKAWQAEERLKKGEYWKANPNNSKEKHCDSWNTCKSKKDKKSPYCPKHETCKEYKSIDRLFTQWNGVPMYPHSPYQFLKKFIAKHNLPDFNIHSLRHTNISLLIMQGVPLPTVAKLAGHADTATTARIYSHSIKTAEQLAVELVANVINPARKAQQ